MLVIKRDCGTERSQETTRGTRSSEEMFMSDIQAALVAGMVFGIWVEGIIVIVELSYLIK
jgi:hypothetical protein